MKNGAGQAVAFSHSATLPSIGSGEGGIRTLDTV